MASTWAPAGPGASACRQAWLLDSDRLLGRSKRQARRGCAINPKQHAAAPLWTVASVTLALAGCRTSAAPSRSHWNTGANLTAVQATDGRQQEAQSVASNQDVEAEPGQQESIWQREQLGGDLGGIRSSLESVGLTLDMSYTIEALRVVDGGLRRRTDVLGDIDLQLSADLEELLGWSGARAFFYGLGNHGDNPSESVGDFQGVSNIEAPNTLRVLEAWFEQEWMDGRASGLVGLYDVNSEFDVIPAATLFINSSHGIGADFGNSGRNGPSIFPVTSLAARFKWRPSEWSYLHAVVADGVPGDPRRPRRTSIRFDDDDGLLLAAEVGLFNLPSEDLRRRSHAGSLSPSERRYGHFGKFALGVWGYTGEVDDLVRVDINGNPLQRSASFGVYALGEQQVFYEPEDPSQGLSVFARAGLADEQVQAIDRYLGAGLVYRGLVPDRGVDELGLAVAAARFGDEFQGAAGGGSAWEDWELTLELTYRAVLAPWLSIQPDLQYVIHPGGDPQVDDALVLGLRGLITL